MSGGFGDKLDGWSDRIRLGSKIIVTEVQTGCNEGRAPAAVATARVVGGLLLPPVEGYHAAARWGPSLKNCVSTASPGCESTHASTAAKGAPWSAPWRDGGQLRSI